MSLAKEATEVIPQSLRRVLSSDEPRPIDKDLADTAILRLLRSRIRYSPDSSSIARHGRMILREVK